MMKNSILIVVGLCVGLVACGGGSSSSSNTDSTNTQTGVFLDSPVVNIGYRTETLEGVTNSLGEYDYVEGETVTFFIGDLEFPPVTAAGTVTPLELADTDDINNSTVINMIRLLQSLDEDGNPDNGITITNTAKSAATQVDFTSSISAFESSGAVTNLVVNSGSSNVSLISEAAAIAHFQTTILAIKPLVGAWKVDNSSHLILYPDNTFLYAENDDEAPNGLELGTYSFDSDTGNITFSITYDDNGPGDDSGVGDVGSPAVIDAVLSSDNNTLTLAGGDLVLDAANFSGSTIVGVWRNTDKTAHLALYENGDFLYAENDSEEPNGVELGTYSYDTNTENITFSITFDNNGPMDDSGVGDIGAPIVFDAILSDSSNTLTILSGELIFSRSLISEGLADNFSFDAATLAGVYEVVGTNSDYFAGTHQYTFNENGSVDIVYEDGTADTESWSVNSDGQLVFSGTIADVFTLTSGSQSSGNMDMVIDDADGSPALNTTGTIEPISALP
jgi:hypothetical protein